MFSITESVKSIRVKVSRSDGFALPILTFLYFLTRLFNILALPIFSDEGIYINWARIAANDPNWRFISLLDGKQPLQTWGTIPFIKLFPTDLLLAGRLFAVFSGFFALIGVMTLAWYLWGRKAGYIAGLLYILCPFFLFYDRMALVDSGVNASIIWILFLSIVLARTLRLDVAILFGFISGVGLLAKSSVFLFLGLSVGALVLCAKRTKRTTDSISLFNDIKKGHKLYVDYLFLFAVSLVIAICMYLSQRFFSPFFHYIGEKNFTFILSPKEWFAHPFALMLTNLRLIFVYVAWESGWIPVIFSIFGLWKLWKHEKDLVLYFLVWIIIPCIVISNFNKVLFPRYLIFFPSFLILLSTYFFASGFKSTKTKIAFLTTILVFGYLSYPMLFNVKAISLPPMDRGQYIEGSTAVWGAQDLMQTVRESTRDGKRALILAEGNFGLIADVLEVFKKPNDKIDIQGLWPLKEEHIYASQKEAIHKHVFVVFSHQKEFPIYWKTDRVVNLIHTYTKPNNSLEAVYLFQVFPQVKK